MKKMWNDRPRHIYVADTELGLLGCAPLKAGSSTWKAWWWYHNTPGNILLLYSITNLFYLLDSSHEGSVPGHQKTISRIPIDEGESLLNSPDKVRVRTNLGVHGTLLS